MGTNRMARTYTNRSSQKLNLISQMAKLLTISSQNLQRQKQYTSWHPTVIDEFMDEDTYTIIISRNIRRTEALNLGV